MGFFNRILFGITCVVTVFCVAMAEDAQIEPCQEGYGFNSVANQCTVCLAGYYGPDANNLCSPCREGYYSRAGSATCTICPPGTYCEDIATGTPTKCPKGTYAWVEGSDEECSCEEGVECDPCDNPGCNLCGATSAEVCVSCPAGTYNNRKGVTECTPCGTGHYSSTVGATSAAVCMKCPKGTASDVEIATSIDTCEECIDGFFARDEGMDACEYCASENGQAMYIPQDKSDCMVCPPGNCCYAYKAYACNKGTFSGGGLPCPESHIAYVGHDTCQANDRGGGNTRGGGSGNVCVAMNFDMFPRKGVCESCPSGCTTETVGAFEASECTVKTINKYCGSGGCFSWPDDGSISEQAISNPDIHLAGSCPR